MELAAWRTRLWEPSLILCMTPNRRLAACLALLCGLVLSARGQLTPIITDGITPKASTPSGAVVTVDLRQHFDLANPVVRFVTTSGAVLVEMLPDVAPLNVANFLSYVDSGAYNNTVIHRAAVFDRTTTTAAIVQGGGFKLPAPVMLPVGHQDPVVLEPVLHNTRGTLAAARTGDSVDSATSEWYFNVTDNTRALGNIVTDETSGEEISNTPGYTVFGQVIEGMETVDALANLPRTNIGSIFQDFPYRDYAFDRPMTVDNTIQVSSVARVSVYPDSGPSLLQFFAESSDPAIATVAIDGLTLRIQPGSKLGMASILIGARTQTGSEVSGYFEFTVSADGSVPAMADVSEPARLTNLSVRSVAGVGDQTLIAGFAISGTGKSPVVLRGVGPGLSQYGVADVLADPRIELYNSAQSLLLSNDDVVGDDGRSAGAFELLAGAKDAVISTQLSPGVYSLQVKGAGNTTGAALAELYEASSAPAGTEVTNLSARTQLGQGEVLIGGFTLSGQSSRTVLVRAVGPGLEPFNVKGTLEDPKLEIFRGSVRIAGNDNWGGDTAADAAGRSIGAFDIARSGKDAAVLLTLPPGSYTAQVRSADGSAGVVLLEVYALP